MVTSSPSRKTRWPSSSARKSMRVSCASVTSASAASGEILWRSAFNASARYIAPVSTYTYPSNAATRRASVLLPEPTGPSIAIINFFSGAVIWNGAISNSFKRSFDFAHGIAQYNRPPVRAAHGILGFCEFAEKPFHFGVVQRSVHFDRRMARSGSSDLRLQRIDRNRLILSRNPIENFAQQLLCVPAGDARGRGLDRDASRAHQLSFETVRAQLVPDLLENNQL